MPIEPNITTRNLTLVLRKVKGIDDAVIERAAKGLRRGLIFAVAKVQTEFLSGPRPTKLDIITRRLRQSITSRADVVPGRGVVGRIGTNVRYGAYHEFGFHGVVNVRAHTRGDQFVGSHTRNVNYGGKPFVRPGLKKAMPIVLREIQSELKDL